MRGEYWLVNLDHYDRVIMGLLTGLLGKGRIKGIGVASTLKSGIKNRFGLIMMIM